MEFCSPLLAISPLYMGGLRLHRRRSLGPNRLSVLESSQVEHRRHPRSFFSVRHLVFANGCLWRRQEELVEPHRAVDHRISGASGCSHTRGSG
jgi:hypothetical protein